MNIIMNNYCNLNCEYCFANEVMSENSKEMTLDDFRKVLDFEAKSNVNEVRLLGGEPTIHPQFAEFVREAYKRKSVKHIQLFTNALFDYDVFDVLEEASKYVSIAVLVNYNEPSVLGEKRVKKIENNIARLTRIGKVTLGINFYKPDQEYEYIIKTTLKHNIKTLRYAVVIPNTIQKAQSDKKKYFKSFVPVLVNFLGVCALKKIEPRPDCNNTPLCMWDDDQLRLLAMVSPTSLKLNLCSPVLDVKTNLEVIRCFGMSEYKVYLDDFRNAEEIHQHFLKNIDEPLKDVDLFDECENCAVKEVNGRSCGCLAYKKQDKPLTKKLSIGGSHGK